MLASGECYAVQEKEGGLDMLKKYYARGFTAVDNVLLHNPLLSAKAKGIIIYLLSKPDGWRANAVDISNNMLDGESSIRTGIKELKEQGFMKLVPEQDSSGQLIGTKWLVADYALFHGNSELWKTLNSENPSLGKSAANNKDFKQLQILSNTEKATSSNKGKKLFPNFEHFTGDFWMEKFQELDNQGIDVLYYYNAIRNWSEVKNVLRTERGWIATMRDWVQRDASKKKIVMLEKNNDGQAAIEYLRRDG